MISLFHTPNYTIDTSRFSNLLHDKIVREFEENFCNYVGARYGCSVHSATSAIFLIFSMIQPEQIVRVPSIIPPVVLNALINAGCMIEFTDNVEWVGNSYVLHEFNPGIKIIDSAQRVDRNQFDREADGYDLMFFSFYPTKPVGSCDGGMIVSNSRARIDELRQLSFNGMTFAEKHWEREVKMVGHKMYMNSIAAYIANENLKLLDHKKERLEKVRSAYNKAFHYRNTSDHLYRVRVHDNIKFIEEAQRAGINCGIHYFAAHHNKVYQDGIQCRHLRLSDYEHQHTVSLPFHEKLSSSDILKIIEFTLPHLHE